MAEHALPEGLCMRRQPRQQRSQEVVNRIEQAVIDLLAEYGITIPKGISHIATHLPDILEDGENGLPGVFRQLIDRLGAHLKELDRQVGELEAQIQVWHRTNAASR